MGRYEEFTRDGKSFAFIDFSGSQNAADMTRVIEAGKPQVRKHPENSLYTITNVENVRITNEINDALSKWAEHNKPYVKYGAVYGVDGIKRTIANAVTVMSKRTNLKYFSSKEECLAWLLMQD